MCSIRNSRISVARVSSCDAERPWRSSGDLIVSSKDVSSTVRLTGLGSHQFRQLNADPGPSAGRRPGDRRQVALVIPGAGGDVEVNPRPAFDELLDEHAAGYRSRLTVVGVLQIRIAALEEDRVVGVDRQSPDPVAGAVGGVPGAGAQGG